MPGALRHTASWAIISKVVSGTEDRVEDVLEDAIRKWPIQPPDESNGDAAGEGEDRGPRGARAAGVGPGPGQDDNGPENVGDDIENAAGAAWDEELVDLIHDSREGNQDEDDPPRRRPDAGPGPGGTPTRPQRNPGAQEQSRQDTVGEHVEQVARRTREFGGDVPPRGLRECPQDDDLRRGSESEQPPRRDRKTTQLTMPCRRITRSFKRAMTFEWIWQTRDSVRSRIRPISFIVSPS